MNQQAATSGNNQKKTGKALLIVVIILALAVAAILIWTFNMKSNLNVLLAEKEVQRVELQKELDSLMFEHEQIKIEYGSLADSLVLKDSIIQENAQEIRKLLDTQWEYYTVKKKLALLQEVSQGYVRQMDSLYRVNAALTEENAEIREDLRYARQENERISKDREELSEKVDQASILQVYNLDAYGVRERGEGRERETDKVNRIDKIKVCFTIGENKVIEPGTKEVYIRIAQPDKLILTKDRSDEYTFMYKGEKIQYSIQKLIDYQNNPMDLCLYWEKTSPEKEMQKGIYHVEVFYKDEVIGHTQFMLR
jgi:hypothetical protein